MSQAKKKAQTRKIAATKRMISPHDDRITKPAKKQAMDDRKAKERAEKQQSRHVTQTSSSLFFAHNESLGPPCIVLEDPTSAWLPRGLLCE
jgi:U3 small nucleolar RNA-associated protein 24